MGKPNQVVVITGAAQRIGAEISRTFHKQGYDIAIHYNTSEYDAKKLAQELNNARTNSAAVFRAELGDTLEIRSMVASILAWREKIGVLINNASRFYPSSFEGSTEQDWDILVNSNLKGAYFLCQSIAPRLEKNGSIISINDIYSLKPLQGYSIYCIAKAGNRMLTKALAKELAPNIRVNGIAPGLIIWPTNSKQMTNRIKQQIIKTIPLQRKGSIKDIALTALFLAMSSTYITGQTITVDGGSSI